MRNPVLIFATVLAAGSLALGLWSWQQWTQTVAKVPAKELSATVLPSPRPLPEIILSNHNGEAVDLGIASSRWGLWFLGFTHCPDVCPNTLGMLAAVRKGLNAIDGAKKIDMVFVSVDPARDSTEKLKSYVQYFDSEMIGLTGSQQDIDTLTQSLYLPYQLDEPDENGHYNVEHSGALVLVNPDNAVHAYFTPPHSAQTLITELKQLTTP